MKYLTWKEAKRLSLLKWKWLILNPGYEYTNNLAFRIWAQTTEPKLLKCECHCGLCQYILIQRSLKCFDCPLHDGGTLCCYEYQNSDSIDIFTRIKNRVQIYDRIMALPDSISIRKV